MLNRGTTTAAPPSATAAPPPIAVPQAATVAAMLPPEGPTATTGPSAGGDWAATNPPAPEATTVDTRQATGTDGTDSDDEPTKEPTKEPTQKQAAMTRPVAQHGLFDT